MKTTKFYGTVNKFNPPPLDSIVTLFDENHLSFDTTVKSEELVKRDMNYDGCEFEIIINESIDGTIDSSFVKVPPKELSKDQLDDIKKNTETDGLFEI